MAPKPIHLRNYVRGAEAAARARRQIEKRGTTINGHPLWTAAEIAVCRQLYPDYKAIKKKLGRRTLVAVCHQCKALGLVPARTAWTGSDVAKLRKLYPTAAVDEILRAFPGRSHRAIKYAANSRGIFRVKRPYLVTGIDSLDQLREHCYKHGFVMRDLDEYAQSKTFFQSQGWRCNRPYGRHVVRAIAELGGRLIVEWPNDPD